MPRISKKRGKTSTYRGLSNHKVCILSAMDDYDQSVFLIAGLGIEDEDKANQLIPYLKIDTNENSKLITDMKQIYNEVVRSSHKNHIEIKSGTHVNDNGESLAGINQLHSEFNQMYRKYRGVSIRHLQGYLDFFAYLKNLKYRISKNRNQRYETYKSSIKEKSTIKVLEITSLPLPINLYEAYGTWRYGCFAN